MDETTIWIIGLGPLVVHKQFIKDISRRNVIWTIDGIHIPLNPRDALLLLYERCSTKYFMFSKYMNQTLGNMMYEHVRNMYWKHHLKHVFKSFVLHAYTSPRPCVKGKIEFILYDKHFKHSGRIKVTTHMYMDNNQTSIRVKNL